MDGVVARLQIKHGPNIDQEYTLSEAEATIGRSSNNDIMIDDPEVSRRHARILRQGIAFQIVDWGSTNGTFVNGRRVTSPTPLQDGDSVELGESVSMIFWQTDANIPPVPQKPIERQSQQSKQNEIETQLDLSSPENIVETPLPIFEPPKTPVKPLQQHDVSQQPAVPASSPPKPARSRWLTCGCLFVILIFLCMATLFFLDAYQGGRLLYCGSLQPFFETILGPFGFAPLCS